MTWAKPWLWLSPDLAHKLSPRVLNTLSRLGPAGPVEWSPLDWQGLHFPNRLGIAGGVDKDGLNVAAWSRLGAGLIEVGTITPEPQPGNAPPVVARDVANEALWNRLGFPSRGLENIKARLAKRARPYPTPLFANIGKNARTPLESAAGDYLTLLRGLEGLVDGFVINISSPNTKGLRELLRPERLRAFLEPLLKIKTAPILLKLSPDMAEDDQRQVLDISSELGIDGWVLTNTSMRLREGLSFPAEGGVSGRPLGELSKSFLKRTLDDLGERRRGKLIVSVGGVMSAADVVERLRLGADLVQVYSALIFEGPFFLRRVAKCPQLNLLRS